MGIAGVSDHRRRRPYDGVEVRREWWSLPHNGIRKSDACIYLKWVGSRRSMNGRADHGNGRCCRAPSLRRSRPTEISTSTCVQRGFG